MYVCICHGFTDKQVKTAVNQGARSTAKVYESFGVRPQCGKCVDCVRDMVRTSPQAVPAMGEKRP